MQIQEKIGSQIRARREEIGMSQRELADEIEVSRQYMNGIETGRRNVSMNVLGRIATALNGLKIELYDANG